LYSKNTNPSTHFIEQILGIPQTPPFHIDIQQTVTNENPGHEPGSLGMSMDLLALFKSTMLESGDTAL
jgi:hypothetical protein